MFGWILTQPHPQEPTSPAFSTTHHIVPSDWYKSSYWITPGRQKVTVNMSTPSAFTKALQRFQTGLTAAEIAEFRVATIDDVWDMASRLQSEQSARHSMQNMARIEPFIAGLTRYAGVIEVFVQAKPDIMAFIWVWGFPCTDAFADNNRGHWKRYSWLVPLRFLGNVNH